MAGRFDLDWAAVDPSRATQTLPLTELYVEVGGRREVRPDQGVDRWVAGTRRCT